MSCIQQLRLATSLYRSGAFCIGLVACGGGGDGPTSSGTADSVTVSLSPATVAVGGAIPRAATITVVSGRADPLQWSSDNPAVATADRTGATAAKVTGLAPGSVTIRASAGKASATATVTVLDLTFDGLVLNGGRHACAHTRSNTFVCWGDHSEGALGPITDPELCPLQLRICGSTPRLVKAPVAFVQMAVGHGGGSCGLTADGVAYCWGPNPNNVLTTDGEFCAPQEADPFSCIHTPTRVRGDVRFASLSFGGQICGLTAQGAAYCLNSDDGTPSAPAEPKLVSGGLTFTSISVGNAHTCGLTAAGTAYCWGANQDGQLGDGTTTDRTAPVAVAGNQKFAGISPARNHTCAVTVAGAAYCWGNGEFGRLGDGTTSSSTVPKPVGGSLVFSAVTTGLEHTCGLTTTGRAWCWGQNNGPQVQGQLGDGTTRSSSVPVAVGRDLTFVELRAGRAFTCGRTAAGKIYCWGDNRVGQLGVGDMERPNSAMPVGVAGVP